MFIINGSKDNIICNFNFILIIPIKNIKFIFMIVIIIDDKPIAVAHSFVQCERLPSHAGVRLTCIAL